MKHIALVSLLCLLCGLATAQTFYRWTDSAGATHYTKTPPPGSDSTAVSTHYSAPGSMGSSSQDSSKAASTDTSKVDSYLKRCAQYRQNLRLLNSQAPLTVKDDEGKTVAIDDAKRQEMLASTKQMLTACPPAEK